MEHQRTTATDLPKWSALLIEAVNKPGLIMKAYRAFHAFSVGNQILALVQCHLRGLQPGPLNTFPKWKDLGRFRALQKHGMTTAKLSAIVRQRNIELKDTVAAITKIEQNQKVQSLSEDNERNR